MKIFIDGGTHKNRICVVEEDGHSDGSYKCMVRERRGNNTNNELEYLALLLALELTRGRTIDAREGLIICTDSQLVANQINGYWSVKNEKLKELHDKCKKKMDSFTKVIWIPRKKNLAGHVLENLLLRGK